MPGALWAYGLNSAGQLGTGSYTTYSQLVRVGTVSTWAWVETSSYHTLAVRSDGTLWGWGDNSHGELGLGATTSQLTPAQVGSDTDWSKAWCVKTSTGAYSLALKTGGELYAAGTDTSGLMGLGATTAANTLTRIGSATYTTVRPGVKIACAVQTDGTVVAWGATWGTSPTAISRTGYTFADAFPPDLSAYPNALYGITTDGALWLVQGPSPAVINQCGTATDWTGAIVGRAYNEGGGSPALVCPIVRSDREIFVLNVASVERRPLYRTSGYTDSSYWSLINLQPEVVSAVSAIKGHHAFLSNGTIANTITGEMIVPPYPDNTGWLDVSGAFYTFPKLSSYPIVTGVARFSEVYPQFPATQAYFFIRQTGVALTGSFKDRRDRPSGSLVFVASSAQPGSLTVCVRLGSDTGPLLVGCPVVLYRTDTEQMVAQATTDATGTVIFTNLDKRVIYKADGEPTDPTQRFGSIGRLVPS